MNTPSRNELTQLFSEPPLEHGDFMTYFRECGTLSKEQLTWQLEQLKDKGVSGTWSTPGMYVANRMARTRITGPMSGGSFTNTTSPNTNVSG